MNALDSTLPEAIRQVLVKVRRSLQAALEARRLDLSLPEAHILQLIHDHPSITPLKIAAQSGYDKAVVARKIKRLAEAGHLARTTDPRDQRRSYLTLTASGQSCWKALNAASSDAHASVFGHLTPQEQAQLRALLCKCL